jgi:hypothetical protein
MLSTAVVLAASYIFLTGRSANLGMFLPNPIDRAQTAVADFVEHVVHVRQRRDTVAFPYQGLVNRATAQVFEMECRGRFVVGGVGGVPHGSLSHTLSLSLGLSVSLFVPACSS